MTTPISVPLCGAYLSQSESKVKYKLTRPLCNFFSRIAVLAGTSFADSFHFSADDLWKSAWNERIAPDIDSYPKDKAGLVDMIAADPSYTMYDNYFSVQTYPAYRQCLVIDIPQAYDPKTFAYAFAKVKEV